jgi:hypothetical protein
MGFHHAVWSIRGCFLGMVPNKHSAEEVNRLIEPPLASRIVMNEFPREPR